MQFAQGNAHTKNCKITCFANVEKNCLQKFTIILYVRSSAVHTRADMYNTPHFLDRRIKWTFIHPLTLKNEQNNPSSIHCGLQNKGLPGGSQGTSDH